MRVQVFIYLQFGDFCVVLLYAFILFFDSEGFVIVLDFWVFFGKRN